jgi:hypothetical protein
MPWKDDNVQLVGWKDASQGKLNNLLHGFGNI